MEEHVSELPVWAVVLLLALVAAAAVTLARPRLSDNVLKRLLLLAGALFVGACVAIGSADVRLFKAISDKQNVLDWLSAALLLSAACVAFRAAARLHRRGSPSPVAMTLSAGFAWAFARELHYGGDFFSDRFWFPRNIFRPAAYFGASYFERFRRDMDLHYSAVTLYVIHICLTAIAAGAFLLLVRYVFSRRAQAITE